MVRQGLEHSFLPGESLWLQSAPLFRTNPACASDVPGAAVRSAACGQLLSASEKARVQWRLEEELLKFEKKY
jgi:hypothetical protein